MEEMKKLLETEFEAVRRRIDDGKKPLPFYYGEENDARRYLIKEKDIEEAEWMSLLDEEGKPTESAKMRVSYTEEGYEIEVSVTREKEEVEIRIDPEFKMFHRTSPLFLHDGKIEIKESASYSLFGDHLEFKRSLFKVRHEEGDGEESYRIKFPLGELEMEKGDPFRLMISVSRNKKRCEVMAKDDRIFERLVLGKFSPDAFAFFIPS